MQDRELVCKYFYYALSLVLAAPRDVTRFCCCTFTTASNTNKSSLSYYFNPYLSATEIPLKISSALLDISRNRQADRTSKIIKMYFFTLVPYIFNAHFEKADSKITKKIPQLFKVYNKINKILCISSLNSHPLKRKLEAWLKSNDYCLH